MKKFLFALFLLVLPLHSFSQIKNGWKTVNVRGGTFQMPDSCKLIVLDTSYLEKIWKLVIGKDTIEVKGWDYSPDYGNDLVESKYYTRTYIDYASSSYERIPEYKYSNSSFDTAVYRKFKKDSAYANDYNLKEEAVAKKRIDDLQKSLDSEIQYRELNAYMRTKLDEYVLFFNVQNDSTNYNNLTADLDGCSLEITNGKLTYEGIYLNSTQQIWRTTNITIKGYLTSKKTMDVLLEILKTIKLNK